MPLRFEWDPEKAASNLEKHGISFDEASSVFGDTLSMTRPDPRHEEPRYVTLGQSVTGALLVVAHTEEGGMIRLVSARRATRREREKYEEA
jgi:uncharacterized DUF497 family protein